MSNSTDRVQRAAMYRQVAAMTDAHPWPAEEGGYTCNHVGKIAGYEEKCIYADIFSPYLVWREPRRRKIRVLMLCFMAAMVEAGDA